MCEESVPDAACHLGASNIANRQRQDAHLTPAKGVSDGDALHNLVRVESQPQSCKVQASEERNGGCTPWSPNHCSSEPSNTKWVDPSKYAVRPSIGEFTINGEGIISCHCLLRDAGDEAVTMLQAWAHKHLFAWSLLPWIEIRDNVT